MYKIAIFTLGCKVNTYESNALMNEFEKQGFEIVGTNTLADVYIINTCSVTNSADSKSRKTINKAINLNKDAIICVMGCYTQTSNDVSNMEGVDIVLGNGNKSSAVSLIIEALENKKEKKTVNLIDIMQNFSYEEIDATAFEHTRAFLKIQDGCDNFCTYCIIPFARGPIKCRDKDNILNSLKNIVDKGYEEVVLTGIHTGKYNNNGYKLSDLIEEILIEIPSLKRIRLSSIEINEVDDKLIELMKNNDVLADHLHLPLQSGCDRILKLMNRKYDTEYFLNKIEKIRSIRKDISITTDVIVGFPTETEEDFLETLEFIKKVDFSELHVFPYSMRKNTVAATMKQVASIDKKNRVDILLKLSSELKNKYYSKFIGKEVSMIVETLTKDGFMTGHSSNYLKIQLPYDKSLLKKMINVEIKEVFEDLCIA